MYVRLMRQISRAVFTDETALCVTDCSDEEIQQEAEYVAASSSSAIDSWLNDPSRDTRKLDLSSSDNVYF